MKILLIDPSYTLDGQILGLGVLTTAQICKDTGWDVQIHEHTEDRNSINAIIDDVLYSVSEFSPQVVGISTRCDTYPFTLKLAEHIKFVYPKVKIVLGGPQATHTDLQSFEICSAIDVIIRGEGEITTQEVLKAIAGGYGFENILGITYLKNGKVYSNPPRPPLESIPYVLNWNAAPQKYKKSLNKNSKFGIETGRGCPYCCSFCCTNTMWNRAYRLRDPDSLYSAMEDVHDRFGIINFSFEHDSLMAGRRFRDFLVRFSELNKKNFRWTCSARIDNFDTTLLPLLENAGCTRVYCGIETASPRMQRIYNKNLDVEKADKKIQYILDNSSIEVILSFVCGHPRERYTDVEATLLMTLHYSQHPQCCNVQLHKLSPVNGSPLFNEYANDLQFTGYISDQAHCSIVENSFSQYIQNHPKVFSSFFDFRHTTIPNEEIYKICYVWQPLCRNFPKTITLLLDKTKMNIISLLKFFDDISFSEAGIEKLLDTHGISMFPLALSFYRFEKNKSNVLSSGSPSKRGIGQLVIDHINNSLRICDVDFDPMITSSESITIKPCKVILWKDSESFVHYKKATQLDQLCLSLQISLEDALSNRYLGTYIATMLRRGMLLQ